MIRILLNDAAETRLVETLLMFVYER
uniref:Uncharacterized protein n=1 Tax=mine drainage metagenome TaxID=410659 RepID=E6Q0P6_9ZZZZ